MLAEYKKQLTEPEKNMVFYISIYLVDSLDAKRIYKIWDSLDLYVLLRVLKRNSWRDVTHFWVGV